MSGIIGVGSKSGIIGETELDYEEGSYTPSIKFGSSAGFDAWNHVYGWYTKIGNVVVFTADIYPSSKSSATGSSHCTLPLTPSTIAGKTPALSHMVHRFDHNNNFMFWYVNRSTGQCDCYHELHDGTAVGQFTNANWVDNTSIWISGSYYVS